MPDFITYNGLQILSTTPVGDGGVALNDNFTYIADHLVTLESNGLSEILGIGSNAGGQISALGLGTASTHAASDFDAAGAAAAITASSLGLGSGISTTLNWLDGDGSTSHSLTIVNGIITGAS